MEEDYSLAWLLVMSPKTACKQNGHSRFSVYETVTFLVELPGPVKYRELRQPWGQLHDHCTNKK